MNRCKKINIMSIRGAMLVGRLGLPVMGVSGTSTLAIVYNGELYLQHIVGLLELFKHFRNF